MNRLTNIPGKELFDLHDPETIQKYLWEMHKGWIYYLNEHMEGEDSAIRLFFFELLWNWISENIQIPTKSEKRIKDNYVYLGFQ
jgi:hypothetical protein